MCDNQYVIKSILKEHNHHLRHHPLFQMIDKFLRALRLFYNIHFHWIPSHTNNKYHSLADKLARSSITASIVAVKPFSMALYDVGINTYTGAFAPGLGNLSP